MYSKLITVYCVSKTTIQFKKALLFSSNKFIDGRRSIVDNFLCAVLLEKELDCYHVSFV